MADIVCSTMLPIQRVHHLLASQPILLLAGNILCSLAHLRLLDPGPLEGSTIHQVPLARVYRLLGQAHAWRHPQAGRCAQLLEHLRNGSICHMAPVRIQFGSGHSWAVFMAWPFHFYHYWMKSCAAATTLP